MNLFSRDNGFTIVEIAIVLIIVGLLLGGGLTIFSTLMKRSQTSEINTELAKAKEGILAFAMSSGRLPCPDSDNDGIEDCPVSNCASSPCNLPGVTINSISDKTLRYDAVDILATTNQQSFCAVLYEIINNAGTGSGGTIDPSVTNTGDTDNGYIDSSSSGYTVSAIIINPGAYEVILTGKNSNTDREYEMKSNPFDEDNRNDVIEEIALGELMSKVCSTSNTRIQIQNNTGSTRYAQVSGSGCTPVSNSSWLSITQGSTVSFFSNATCSTACGGAITFDTASSTTDWAGDRDGQVQITGSCSLSDV